jgi:predicted nucleic acid-binding protein
MRYRKNPYIRQQAFSFLELLDQIQPPVLTIIQVSASVDKQTSKLLKKYRDLPLSYCDATSIVLADQFGVD